MEFFSKITAPIAGDNPFGADVNHDVDYERLKGEMGKLGDIDVDVVEALSFKILTEKSKDVRALAFLAYAALRKGEIGRLADVFCALADYCQNSFDEIFPLRESAKLAALRWFSDQRFGGQCAKADVSSIDDKPQVARLKEALERLRPALEKKFASTGAPFPHALYKRAAEWERSFETSKPAEQPVDKNDKSAATKTLTTPKPSATPLSTASVTLSPDEYREIVECVNKMGAILKKTESMLARSEA